MQPTLRLLEETHATELTHFVDTCFKSLTLSPLGGSTCAIRASTGDTLASRAITWAALSGFLTFIQCGERPDRYGTRSVSRR
jgi:hypothetical protein